MFLCLSTYPTDSPTHSPATQNTITPPSRSLPDGLPAATVWSTTKKRSPCSYSPASIPDLRHQPMGPMLCTPGRIPNWNPRHGTIPGIGSSA